MPLVHNYDFETHEYIGSSKARVSPLEEGVYLCPAYATTKAPPDCKEGFVAVFEDGAWVTKAKEG